MSRRRGHGSNNGDTIPPGHSDPGKSEPVSTSAGASSSPASASDSWGGGGGDSLPGVAASSEKAPRTPLDAQLILLRQAYQEHGKALGYCTAMVERLAEQQLSSVRTLEHIVGAIGDIKDGLAGIVVRLDKMVPSEP